MKERPFPFPHDKSIRVIIDTDAACEADDQYAIAHALLTPRFDIKAFISEQFISLPGSEEESYNEIKKIISLMNPGVNVSIYHGASSPLKNEKTASPSEGAKKIIEEALKDDERALFICGQGALTNIASAILMAPEIQDRFTLIWIGGGEYPDGKNEFNARGDIAAANVVFRSSVPLWQVPRTVYSTMRISFTELLENVYPCGKLGKYLVENTMEVAGRLFEKMGGTTPDRKPQFSSLSRAEAVTRFSGELWSLGDSVCIGLMMNSNLGRWHISPAPYGFNEDTSYDFSRKGRKIRIYDTIDSHFILSDMLSKFRYYLGND